MKNIDSILEEFIPTEKDRIAVSKYFETKLSKEPDSFSSDKIANVDNIKDGQLTLFDIGLM